MIKWDPETLNEHFQTFGEIETIEMLNFGKMKAYITYKSDRSAYKAVSDSKFNCDYWVVAASTWKQPQPHQDEDAILDKDYMPPIFILDQHHCLLKIFDYLDFDSHASLSEVCTLFNKMMHKQYFHKIKSFEFDNTDGKPKVTLGQVRRNLKCIGPYIDQLKFVWNPAMDGVVRKSYIKLLGQYVGENIRSAKFDDVYFAERESILAIAPLLKRLTSLEVVTKIHKLMTFALKDDWSYMDYRAICPNLTKLKLKTQWKFFKLCKTLPKLEYLSVDKISFARNTFEPFCQRHPQITTLKLSISRDDGEIQAIVQYLSNIIKLSIEFKDDYSRSIINGSNLSRLTTLRNLKKLNFYNVQSFDFDDISSHIIPLKTLRELKLIMHPIDNYNLNQQSVINIAKNLPNLEKFYARGMQLKKSTVLEFISLANNVKEIHIHSCDLEINQAFILNIVKVLKSSESNTTAPLKLFIDKNKSFDLNSVQMPHIQKYLCVNDNCSHSDFLRVSSDDEWIYSLT